MAPKRVQQTATRERSAFGETLAAALRIRGVTQRELGARLGGVTQSSVSAWRSGNAEPPPRMVFTVERALDLPPGQLSRHLGYVPNEALDKPPSSFDDVVLHDPLLGVVEKRALLALYREFMSHGGA